MTRGIGTISGGEGSWRATKVWRKHNPTAELLLIMTDTLYEDADTYRAMLEMVADVLERPVNWIPSAEDFPDYRVSEDVPISEYAGNPEWRAFLADLREKARVAFPEFLWIAEGRDVWEIYRDERFVGNSRVDPCSKLAKRKMLERWRKEHGDKENDVIIWGISDHERHRFEAEDVDGNRTGIKPRLEAEGWTCVAPLIDYPGPHYSLIYAPIEDFGMKSQRLYSMGYMHANCGGMCCKAGFAHWQNRRRVQPERFDYDRTMERKLREYLGQGTFLTETFKGRKRAVSLDELNERLLRSPELLYEYREGESGCGCMLDEAA